MVSVYEKTRMCVCVLCVWCYGHFSPSIASSASSRAHNNTGEHFVFARIIYASFFFIASQ